MADNLKLKLVMEAKDGISGAIKKAVTASDAEFEKLQKKIAGTSQKFSNFGKATLGVGAAITAASGLNIKAAADFETSMTNVDTIIESTKENIVAMGSEVQKIAKETPVELDSLTEGLYNIRSAGISAADQFTVLKKSAQLAVAGLGTTNEAVDLVTSSLNAFGLKGSEAQKVYDNIFKVVKYGKTNISGLAQGFGATAGVVASSKIKLDEYLASVAALTTTGQPAAQAHTQMKAAVAGLTRGTKEQQAIFHKLGAKDFKDLIQKSGGMVNAFKGIVKATKGNEAEIIKLVGSIEAYNAIMSLTGAQNGTFVSTLDDMRNGSDALAEGFAKKLKNANSALMIGRNILQSISIGFGNALLPYLNMCISGFIKVSNVLDKINPELKNTISVGVAGFGLLSLGAGTLSMAISGIITGYSKILETYRKLDVFVWGKFPKFYKGLQALPTTLKTIKSAIVGINITSKGLMASTGIGLLIMGAALLIYKYWKPISGFFKGLFTGISQAVAPLKPAFKSLFSAVSGVVNVIAQKFPILKPIIDGIKGAVKGVYGWFKTLLKPVEDVDNAAQNLGLQIGRSLSGAVNWAAKLIGKFTELVTLGGRIKIGGGDSAADKKVDGSHAAGLSNVPFNGYIAELHQGEAVLTRGENARYRSVKNNQSSNITISYAPNVTISGASEKAKDEFLKMLEAHKREIANIVEQVQARRLARAYV